MINYIPSCHTIGAGRARIERRPRVYGDGVPRPRELLFRIRKFSKRYLSKCLQFFSNMKVHQNDGSLEIIIINVFFIKYQKRACCNEK